MKNMVRLSASEQAAKQNTDLKADPGYSDLYIPRKEGDSTGSSTINNNLAEGLSAEVSGEAAAAASASVQGQQVARPIKLGDKTKFPGVSNVNALQTGTGAFQAKPGMDYASFMAGLFGEFNDPMILEYFEQENAAPQIVNQQTEYRYANKLKESDAV